MKKSILLGCIAASALMTTVAFADTAIVKPTADEIKTAFTDFLNTRTKAGSLFDLEKMTVTAAGDGFDLTVPAVQDGQQAIPSKSVHLTYAGEFNQKAQYKIEAPFEIVQSLFKDILPQATFGAESADITTIWVPAYNLVSKNSENIKGLKLNVPNMFDLSLGSLVSDGLVRVVDTDKMDAADSTDGHDLVINADGVSVIVPSFSYESSLTGSDITSDPLKQLVSCTNSLFKYSVPDIQLKMQGAAATMASLTLSGQGAYQNEVLHLENKVENIASSALGAFAPAALIPSEIIVNLDFEGVEKDVMKQLVEAGQKGEYTDEIVPALKKAVETGVVKINLIEAKNSLAGIAVSGTFSAKLKDAENVITVEQFADNMSPVFDAKVVVTNLDQISPEPKVDQMQCDRAQERLNKIDMSAPDAEMQKETAEMQKEIACAPQGGPLDMLRPYLDLNNRVANTDGTTMDTFIVTYEDDVLTVNGKQVQ